MNLTLTLLFLVGMQPGDDEAKNELLLENPSAIPFFDVHLEENNQTARFQIYNSKLGDITKTMKGARGVIDISQTTRKKADDGEFHEVQVGCEKKGRRNKSLRWYVNIDGESLLPGILLESEDKEASHGKLKAIRTDEGVVVKWGAGKVPPLTNLKLKKRQFAVISEKPLKVLIIHECRANVPPK